MREFLERSIAAGMQFTTLVQYALSAALIVGIAIVLLARSPWPRHLSAALMVSVWAACFIWMLLDAIEAFTYDRAYALLLLIFPGEYMGLSLLLATTGLILLRLRQKRERAAASRAALPSQVAP